MCQTGKQLDETWGKNSDRVSTRVDATHMPPASWLKVFCIKCRIFDGHFARLRSVSRVCDIYRNISLSMSDSSIEMIAVVNAASVSTISGRRRLVTMICK